MAPNDEPGKSHVKSFCGLGSGQIVLGIVCIGLDVAYYILLYKQKSRSFDGGEYLSNFPGFWAGVFFLIAGMMSVCASCHASACRVNGAMIFSIISAIMAIIMLVLEIGLAQDSKSTKVKPHKALKNLATTKQLKASVFGLHVALAVMGLFETIIAIITSAISCASICCKKEAPFYGMLHSQASFAPLTDPGRPAYPAESAQPAYPAEPDYPVEPDYPDEPDYPPRTAAPTRRTGERASRRSYPVSSHR